MFEDIYDIFKLEMDGEEFDTDDDAVLASNLAMRDILDDRDWRFLSKTTTLSAGTLSLASITDLDKVTNIYVANREVPLAKATLDQRYDSSYDYYIDIISNTVVLINNDLVNTDLIIEYKYRPDDLTLTNNPLATQTQNRLKKVIAYAMTLTFYDKDQDLSVYTQLRTKYEDSLDRLIAYNESI